MEDSEDIVNSKIKKAFCPEKNILDNGTKIHDVNAKPIVYNPILTFCEKIIYPSNKIITLKRTAENGGDKTYNTYEEILKEYEEGLIHPGDLKPAVAKAINLILQPIRDHFKNNQEAKELL